ncbi:acyltransferase family protein [Trujillonella humicola]|uniref:acyltransferase family protein n=1 Tax=Trujillonella humicola TaxID=3383699 RepID=UPI0039064D36
MREDTATGPDATRRRDIPALTGLRAVAACWVVLFHVQMFTWPYLDQLPLVRPLIAAGWTGVELFFVLSGFVITLTYGQRMGSRPRLGQGVHFLVNRVARVWPAWAVVTVLAGAWVWSLRKGGWDADVITTHADADLGSLVSQLTMTQMWGRIDHAGASFVLPGWSISAEWTAYLLFPVVVVLVWQLRRLPAWLLMVLAVAAMSPLSYIAFTTGTPDHQQDWMLRIACGFTAGMLTALAVRRIRVTERVESVALAALVSSIGLVVTGSTWAMWNRGTDYDTDYSAVVVVAFPVIVAALALTSRGPARWLSSAPLVYGGKISYALYLVHFLVLDVVITLWWQDPATRGELTPGLALAMPALVLACLLLSAALHHGVEEPGRRLVLAGVARLTGRRAPRRRAAGTPLPVVLPEVVPTAEVPVAVAAGPRTERLLAVGRGTDVPPVRPLRAVAPAAGSRPPARVRSGAAG